MIALDKIEAKSLFSSNIVAFSEECQELEDYMEDCNPPENQTEYEDEYNNLRKEGLTAIAKEDAVLLEHIVKKMKQLNYKCTFSDPFIMSSWVQNIIKDIQEIITSDPSLPSLINKAQDALEKLDVIEMREALWELYPFVTEEKKSNVRLRSGITL
jgi:hypothetical protein